MAENLNLPPGAALPPTAGSKVQPKKETVRISLPPKPTAKETVRLALPPRTAATAAPAAPGPAAPVPLKTSAAKETVRLELPPKPVVKAPAGAGGHEIKLVVPQVDQSAASAIIPDATDAEMPTMDSSQAAPAPVAGKPGGLKGAPPGSRLAGGVVATPGKVGAQPDSMNSALALPAKKGMASAPVATGGVVVRAASWPDYTLVTIALLAGIAAVVRLFMILGGN